MRYWAICVLQFFVTKLWRHKFRNKPYLFNQAVFSTCRKSQDRNLNILRTKRAFKMKQKTFFINLEGLSLNQIKIFFGRSESDFKMFIVVDEKYLKIAENGRFYHQNISENWSHWSLITLSGNAEISQTINSSSPQVKSGILGRKRCTWFET